MTLYGATRPQWFNSLFYKIDFVLWPYRDRPPAIKVQMCQYYLISMQTESSKVRAGEPDESA